MQHCTVLLNVEWCVRRCLMIGGVLRQADVSHRSYDKRIAHTHVNGAWSMLLFVMRSPFL
jgi:hypothetical protein